MHATSRLVALAAGFSTAMAAFQGFNYGSTFTTGAAKTQSDFEAEFKTAAGLVGAPAGGFTSARLYTTVQGGTANDPISAIPAALNTKTTLLLGIWASAGDAVFNNELKALKSAIEKYGSDFGKLVAGISVGSEDLYRSSPTGILNKENPGAQPNTIARYIKEVRDTIAGTPLQGAPIGHVDTWTAWVNGSNQAVINACDWIGFDAYPYFQETNNNAVSNSKALFDDALAATQAAVGGKPVWITETGYPVSGKTVGQAVPSLENAKKFWDAVGCPMFGKTNVWWYTFQDAAPQTPNPSFGIIGNALSKTPLYDISCKDVAAPSSPSISSSATLASPSATGTGSSSAPTGGVIGGGSPGAGTGLPGSQASIESSTLSTGISNPTGASPTGGPSGSGPANNTISAGAPSSTSPATNPNGATALSGSVGSAVIAMMAAIMVL